MEPRIDMANIAPGAYKAMGGLEVYLRHCGLEESLLHLLKQCTPSILHKEQSADRHLPSNPYQ